MSLHYYYYTSVNKGHTHTLAPPTHTLAPQARSANQQYDMLMLRLKREHVVSLTHVNDRNVAKNKHKLIPSMR